MGLRSMPSLKRRSISFSGVSGSSSMPSLKRGRRSVPGGSSCEMPRAKFGSSFSSGVSGLWSMPSAKPSSSPCSGRAGCSSLQPLGSGLLGRAPFVLVVHQVLRSVVGRSPVVYPAWLRDKTLVGSPFDGPAERLRHRRVLEPQLARRSGSVVPVAVQQRAHHLAADRRGLAADAERRLDERPRDPGDRWWEEAHVVADARQLGHDLERLARGDRGAVEDVALARSPALGPEKVALDAIRDVHDADRSSPRTPAGDRSGRRS